MLAHSCSLPECLQWQLPECQPDGENHEAAQAATPVPLGFTQTVCLTGYVPCTSNRFSNLRRYSDLIVLVSSEHSIIPVSTECLYLFPAKIMSRLARWVAITYEEYRVCVLLCACVRAALQSRPVILRSSIFLSLQDLPYTQHVTDAGLAKETDLYFMGVVERGTGASLCC